MVDILVEPADLAMCEEVERVLEPLGRSDARAPTEPPTILPTKRSETASSVTP